VTNAEIGDNNIEMVVWRLQFLCVAKDKVGALDASPCERQHHFGKIYAGDSASKLGKRFRDIALPATNIKRTVPAHRSCGGYQGRDRLIGDRRKKIYVLLNLFCTRPALALHASERFEIWHV